MWWREYGESGGGDGGGGGGGGGRMADSERVIDRASMRSAEERLVAPSMRTSPQLDEGAGETRGDGQEEGSRERETGKRERAEAEVLDHRARALAHGNRQTQRGQTQATNNVQGRQRSACALAGQNRQAKKQGRPAGDEEDGLPNRRRDAAAHGGARANRKHNEFHFGVVSRGSMQRRSLSPLRRGKSRGAVHEHRRRMAKCTHTGRAARVG